MRIIVDGTEYEATKVKPPAAKEWEIDLVLSGYKSGATFVQKADSIRDLDGVRVKLGFDSHGVYFADGNTRTAAARARAMARNINAYDESVIESMLDTLTYLLVGPPPK